MQGGSAIEVVIHAHIDFRIQAPLCNFQQERDTLAPFPLATVLWERREHDYSLAAWKGVFISCACRNHKERGLKQ